MAVFSIGKADILDSCRSRNAPEWPDTALTPPLVGIKPFVVALREEESMHLKSRDQVGIAG